MKPKLISTFLVLLLIPGVVLARTSLEDLNQKLDTLINAIAGSDIVPVTLIQRVYPDNTPEDRTGDTTETQRVCIGTSTCTTADAALSNRIHQDSDEILVVTGISANIYYQGLPPTDGYGMLNFGACQTGQFPHQFGVPTVTVEGRGTAHVTFRPGIQVGNLTTSQRLCFTSYSQSTEMVDVALHGYLMPRP